MSPTGPVTSAVLAVLVATGSFGGVKWQRNELGQLLDKFGLSSKESSVATDPIAPQGKTGEEKTGDEKPHQDGEAGTDGDGASDSTGAFPKGTAEHNDSDAFPHDFREWRDADGDGIVDNRDKFPSDPKEWKEPEDPRQETPAEKIGDVADADADGVPDNEGAFPSNLAQQKDTDSNGVADNAVQEPEDSRRETPAEKIEELAETPSEGSPPPEAIQALFNPPRELLLRSIEKWTSIQLPQEWKTATSWTAIGVTCLVLVLSLAAMVGLGCSFCRARQDRGGRKQAS